MTVSEKFGKSLRRLRKERGWSQEYLASLVNSTKQVISSYETCQRIPNIYTAAEYARVFGVQLEEMIDVYPAQPNDVLEALHQNPKLRLLFDKSKNLSSKDIDAVLAVVSAISRERDDNE